MGRPPLSSQTGDQNQKTEGYAGAGESSARIQGLAQLRDLIDQHFSLDEIQTLSFDLGIEFEHLAGNTRPLKIQNLIIYLSQRDRLPELMGRLQDQRPSVSWQNLALEAQPGWTATEVVTTDTTPGSPRPVRWSQYLDFEIEVGLGAGRDYPVTIIHSPAGEARETMRFPYDELALENRLQSLKIALLYAAGGQRQVLTDEERLVQEFGRDLFNALFSGEARSRFDISCAEARQQGKGLRLKLRLNPPELARLPWEFLYDPRRAEYICLSRETPIIRYLELPQLIQPLAVSPPLRVLGMTVSPQGLEPLDIGREKRRVEKALAPLQANDSVQLTWLAGASWRDLHRAMREGPWHIFHFIGHGGFDRQADEGFIALTGDDGRAQPLLATELGRLLADHFPLRLVLLNSCEGAMGSEHDIFSSTAAILVRRGLPAVLAMQYGITDRGAIEFSRAFYEALSDNLTVDAAVAEARKAVSLAKTYTVEWGTPVLYMRAPQGVIFNITEVRQPMLPDVPETDSELEQRLEQLYTDGLSAFWIEDWDKACRCFRSILDVRPGHSGAAERLAQAKRQKTLADLYTQSEAAGDDWPAAITALEQLVAEEPSYRDAQSKLEHARQQKHLVELASEAQRLGQASQWLAVVNVYAQIHALDPAYPEPEGLLAKAQQEVAEANRLQQLNDRYGRAVRELDAGHLAKAVEMLASVAAEEPHFRETEQLLSRAREEIARREAERKRQEQIEALYVQVAGLVQAKQWEQALTRMEEIRSLEPTFEDPDRLEAKAQQAIAAAEIEGQRQAELAALYAEAVNLLKAQEYQAALDKWAEVQGLDPHYRDRHKVRRTARKKLRQLSQGEVTRRWPDKKWLSLGAIVFLIVAAVSVALLLRRTATDEQREQVVADGSEEQGKAAIVNASCPEITDWRAEYWSNADLSGEPAVCRSEQYVSNEWRFNSPKRPEIPIDHWSARYTASVYFPEGVTRFALGSADGARLYIDGQLYIDDWGYHDYQGQMLDVYMDEGEHEVIVEYRQGGGYASLSFEWGSVNACADGIAFCDDFEGSKLIGWSLDPGWSVEQQDDNHYLHGQGEHWAVLNHQGWRDYRLRLRVLRQRGAVHINYRYGSDGSRYLIRMADDSLSLSREKDGQLVDDLAHSFPGRVYSQDRWYDVEIVGTGNHIFVYVDRLLQFEYTDDNPLLEGSIALETPQSSVAQIDDVEVILVE